MAVSAKTIKTRIRSIKNISKITKAMELVAATKMRKSGRLAESGRPYDSAASEVMESILLSGGGKGKFFAKVSQPRKVAVILFSSNRGLCGSFNSQIVNFAVKNAGEAEVSWVVVGRKGSRILSRLGQDVIAEFAKPESYEEADEFFPAAKFVTEKFQAGEFDEVRAAYTDFVSPLKLIPRLYTLLPFHSGVDPENYVDSEKQSRLVFEPGRDEVLSFLAPRYIEDKLYQALLESNASEHSARMAAMKNASDAAGEIIDELVFDSNELRQAAITREIAEIAGGKAAVE